MSDYPCYFVDPHNEYDDETQIMKQAFQDWKEIFMNDVWPEMYQCGCIRSRLLLVDIAIDRLTAEREYYEKTYPGRYGKS